MMPRIGRHVAPLKPTGPLRKRKSGFAVVTDDRDPEVALSYSNGYVTVEISQAALDAYIDMTGDVPLPVAEDPETGDRRTYDARNNIRVVYDADANLREISTRSSDGLFVRINFTDGDPRAS
jgi:hypothetical protein